MAHRKGAEFSGYTTKAKLLALVGQTLNPPALEPVVEVEEAEAPVEETETGDEEILAVVIDPRPTYFGDRIVITGTYAASDTSIALGDLLTSIDMAVVTPAGFTPQNLETGGQADGTDATPFIFGEFATVSGTTITVNTIGGAQATAGGTFFAIGRR